MRGYKNYIHSKKKQRKSSDEFEVGNSAAFTGIKELLAGALSGANHGGGEAGKKRCS